MTYPLIAFFMWLLSTPTIPSGNPAQEFIKVAGIDDSSTQMLLMSAGTNLPPNPSLTAARQGFAAWLEHNSQDNAALYPRSCSVQSDQIKAIANIAAPMPINTIRPDVAAPGAIQPGASPPTPYYGIALFLYSLSTSSWNANGMCSTYNCSTAQCGGNPYLNQFFAGLQDPKFKNNVGAAQTFYRQYLTALSKLGVKTTSYPEGWVCAIKNPFSLADVGNSVRSQQPNGAK
jgi:hypothetical protein